MRPAVTNWNEVALNKLTNVMGASAGQKLAQSVLREVGIERVSSAADLKRFADSLSRHGGFASAVGALLALHATMYGGAAEPGADDAR
jgi:hypothetical protein